MLGRGVHYNNTLLCCDIYVLLLRCIFKIVFRAYIFRVCAYIYTKSSFEAMCYSIQFFSLATAEERDERRESKRDSFFFFFSFGFPTTNTNIGARAHFTFIQLSSKSLISRALDRLLLILYHHRSDDDDDNDDDDDDDALSQKKKGKE